MRAGDLLREAAGALAGSRSRTLLTSAGVTVGSLAEVAVIVAVSVSPSEAVAGISTWAVRLSDSWLARMPVLSMEKLVGQLFPETVTSKL